MFLNFVVCCMDSIIHNVDLIAFCYPVPCYSFLIRIYHVVISVCHRSQAALTSYSIALIKCFLTDYNQLGELKGKKAKDINNNKKTVQFQMCRACQLLRRT